MKLLVSILLFTALPMVLWSQMTFSPVQLTQAQNFNTMGSSATATLPTGFRVSNGTTFSAGTTATTHAAGTSGTGTLNGSSTGGTYNFANGVSSSSTDRSLGFLNSGSFTSPRSIMLQIKNETGANITELIISFNYEKSRSGSRDWSFTFFHGPSGSGWTAATGGNQNFTADANNTVIFNPPTSTPKSFTITGLNIANGASYYLRWTLTGNGGSTNGQALSIDDVSITAVLEALPVTLLSFNTVSNKENQVLSWTYESPENFSYFDIEHSRDAKNFTSIGKVLEGENISGKFTANFTHINPGSGFHYYRLKMLDLNGSFKYSQVIQCKIESISFIRPLSTFISSEGLSISVERSVRLLELTLVDQLGRRVYHSKQPAEKGFLNIPITHLNQELYYLQINADGEINTYKLIR